MKNSGARFVSAFCFATKLNGTECTSILWRLFQKFILSGRSLSIFLADPLFLKNCRVKIGKLLKFVHFKIKTYENGLCEIIVLAPLLVQVFGDVFELPLIEELHTNKIITFFIDCLELLLFL